MSEEQILVIPRACLGEFIHFRGFRSARGADLDEWIRHGAFQPRAAMEHDPSFKQLIPYILLRWNGADLQSAQPADSQSAQPQVFRYQRTPSGGENRLFHLYSLGIGGHINPIDQDTTAITPAVLWGAAIRELQEETHLGGEVNLQHVGFLNDDENPVGQVHLGVVYEAWLSQPEMPSVILREGALAQGEWKSLAALLDGVEYETWSRFLIDQYLLLP